MSIKRPPLVNGEIYHIIIRAVEGLKLFRDKQDHLRMIHNLFEFNNENSTISTYRNAINRSRSRSRSDLDSLPLDRRKRRLLIEILAFCFMPNHVHLLVKQVRDGGVSKFMQKLGIGYGLYYNQKYKRLGHVFGGRYKIVHIINDNQLKAVFVYIHTNPVAIIFPKWKEEGIKTKDLRGIINFLEEYRWSSYSDYLGKKNFPSLTIRDFLIQEMGGIQECRRFVDDWLQQKKKLAELDQVLIE